MSILSVVIKDGERIMKAVNLIKNIGLVLVCGLIFSLGRCGAGKLPKTAAKLRKSRTESKSGEKNPKTK